MPAIPPAKSLANTRTDTRPPLHAMSSRRGRFAALMWAFFLGCERGETPPEASARHAPAVLPNDAAKIDSKAPPADPKRIVTWVLTRDGIRLYTEVLLPKSGPPPYPVVLIRGPYSGYVNAFTIMSLREQGYALVVQDSRGCGKSEGQKTIIFTYDGWGTHQDGHDTIEWINRQPWANGRIGTFGFSALGMPAVLLAPEAPPALACQFVLFACSNFYSDCCYQGGVWRGDIVDRWLPNNGLEANLPILKAHPCYDDIWRQLDPRARAERIDAPGVFVAGWFDMFAQGSIDLFTAVQHQGGPRARGQCRLIIGPWAHRQIEGMHYPNADMYRDHPKAGDPWRFFAHHLKGEPNGVERDQPVHYYVMGDPSDPASGGCLWRSADAWPPPSNELELFFQPAGTLATDPNATEPARRGYAYDPADPVPTIGGANFGLDSGPLDQRPIEKRPDVLLFTSPPLDEPLEVTGRIAARLFVSSDCPDTDFTVKLTDVYPDGRSHLVADGIQRASFHASPTYEKQTWLKPGEVIELGVDLWSTSLVFARGHRLRVAVSSSNAPRFQPNPNTGQPPERLPARVANNVVYLSRSRPSRILLPVPVAGPAGIVRWRTAD